MALTTLLVSVPVVVVAAPPPAIHPALLNQIRATPEGSWAKVSTNSYSAVWTPADLRPLKGLGNPFPSVIIGHWSSFAWDTLRGDLLLYGGGHSTYSGNDVYRWRSSTLQWERAALPSEIQRLGATTAFAAIDGAFNAPAAAHTYDNNVYLPVVDRFLTWGGALYDSGASYAAPDEANPGSFRQTGPYLFDPSRAHPDRVGGTTGSHVQRVAAFPQVVGGEMWENRDIPKRLAGQRMPGSFVNGCTSYAEEGGRDVVYVGGTENGSSALNVYRYRLDTLANPASDSIDVMGIFWNGTAGRTTCAHDPLERLFVRTGSNAIPFIFWDLATPGPGNRDQRVDVTLTIQQYVDWLATTAKEQGLCALDFDPVRGQYAVWCGDGAIWMLTSPVTRGTSGWQVVQQPTPSGAVPPYNTIGTGVQGKWRYAPGYDVFVGLENSDDGNVWIYKPLGWQAPNNASPSVALTSPAGGASYVAPASVALGATASDADGSITKVEFYNGNSLLATLTSPPYTYTWTGVPAGTYTLTARATDDAGETRTSTGVTITVAMPPNVPPQVALTQPTTADLYYSPAAITLVAAASDNDGSIARVEFLSGTQVIGTSTAAPYTMVWTAVPAGNYSLAARAIDNAGASTLSPAVNVVVQAPPAPVNVAASANGGVASASSTLARARVASVNDGSRKTAGSRSTAAWIDATYAQFPDWLQIDFDGVKTIARVDVVTVQDGSFEVLEPTPETAFVRSGVTAFEVQTWNGSTWVMVPGGLVTGNNRVWRTLTFPPVATDRVRVLVHGAASGYSQIAEIEAWTGNGPSVANVLPVVTLELPGNGAVFTTPSNLTLSADAHDPDGLVTQVEFLVDGGVVGVDSTWPYTVTWTGAVPGTYTIVARVTDDNGGVTTSAPVGITLVPAGSSVNAALQSNGGVATASSSLTLGYPPSSAIDGDRAGLNWTRNGGWVDATGNAFPDWLAVQFEGIRSIGRIDVFTVQDAIEAPSAPTPALMFARYGIVDYEVQWWNGIAWATVPGGIVTGNTHVWRSFVFPPVSTDRIRVLVNGALDGYSRIVEIEAWTAP